MHDTPVLSCVCESAKIFLARALAAARDARDGPAQLSEEDSLLRQKLMWQAPLWTIDLAVGWLWVRPVLEDLQAGLIKEACDWLETVIPTSSDRCSSVRGHKAALTFMSQRSAALKETTWARDTASREMTEEWIGMLALRLNECKLQSFLHSSKRLQT
jgi:hypothetical protein